MRAGGVSFGLGIDNPNVSGGPCGEALGSEEPFDHAEVTVLGDRTHRLDYRPFAPYPSEPRPSRAEPLRLPR
jgi:hypothetical protein